MRHGDCVQFKVCVVDSRVQDCSGKCEPVLITDRQASGSPDPKKKMKLYLFSMWGFLYAEL